RGGRALQRALHARALDAERAHGPRLGVEAAGDVLAHRVARRGERGGGADEALRRAVAREDGVGDLTEAAQHVGPLAQLVVELAAAARHAVAEAGEDLLERAAVRPVEGRQ